MPQPEPGAPPMEFADANQSVWGAEALADDEAERLRKEQDLPDEDAWETEDRASKAQTTRPPPLLDKGLVPSKSSAAHFEQGIADPFVLGELMSWSAEQLFDYTRDETDRGERFHVHLVADVEAGIGALLPLAGPPSERWVLGSLSPNRKIFGLSFYLRYGRKLDIVLVDIEHASDIQHALGRNPSLTILAPADGDFLSMGTRARVEIENLLAYTAPQTFMSLGNETLGSNLEEFEAIRSRTFPTTSFAGTLGSGNTDFRSVLVQGIRAWAKDAPPGSQPNP